jgi:predicted Zn-dependent protease
MKYSNPQIPEGINTSKQHPLREFFVLTAGVVGAIVMVVLVLGFFADRLAHHIPFSVELDFVEKHLLDDTNSGPMQAYLEGLVANIVVVQELANDMRITIHYLDDDTVNAFATLGGHIYLFRGLLEKMPNENALVMVLAHEIAHIKHRHPIRNLGRSIIVGLALSMASGTMGDMTANQIISNTGMLTSLTFSRDQERECDDTALETLMSIYGTTAGADQLFEVLKEAAGSREVPEFFNTHPLSDNRIQQIQAFSRERSANTRTVKPTPLPAGYTQWLNL